MNNMPKKLRKELDANPFYHVCARAGLFGHVCAGRVTWDHAVIVAGKQLQEGWAIVPLCEKAHGVGRFLDLHDKNPEMSQWIALCRAPQVRLEELTRLGGVDYIRRRNYLNDKYGPYTYIEGGKIFIKYTSLAKDWQHIKGSIGTA